MPSRRAITATTSMVTVARIPTIRPAMNAWLSIIRHLRPYWLGCCQREKDKPRVALNNITAGVCEREDANRTRVAGDLDEIQGVVASTPGGCFEMGPLASS